MTAILNYFFPNNPSFLTCEPSGLGPPVSHSSSPRSFEYRESASAYKTQVGNRLARRQNSDLHSKFKLICWHRFRNAVSLLSRARIIPTLFLPRGCIFADARSCTTCDRVLQELEQIDDDTDSFGVDFVKINDKRLAKHYGITKFPALTYFREKQPIIYEGEWMRRSSLSINKRRRAYTGFGSPGIRLVQVCHRPKFGLPRIHRSRLLNN